MRRAMVTVVRAFIETPPGPGLNIYGMEMPTAAAYFLSAPSRLCVKEAHAKARRTGKEATFITSTLPRLLHPPPNAQFLSTQDATHELQSSCLPPRDSRPK